MKREIKDYLHLYIGCEVTKDHREGVIEKGTLVGVCKSEVEPDCTLAIVDCNGYEFAEWYVEEAKPTLRSLNSITEEEYADMAVAEKSEWKTFLAIPDKFEDISYYPSEVHYLLVHHFDLFNLIPEGLANERVG